MIESDADECAILGQRMPTLGRFLTFGISSRRWFRGRPFSRQSQGWPALSRPEANARALDVADQFPLRAGIAVNITFGGFDGAMPREQLNVAQAAAGAMDIAGRDRDEAPPPGMRGTAFKSEFFKQDNEPIDDAVRFKCDDRSGSSAQPAPWSAPGAPEPAAGRDASESVGHRASSR